MGLNQRFFESTRGRIVTMLRHSPATVEELATHLNLTDNAVRSHLSTLERDGLVRQSGTRRGTRKPHFTYALTAEAERLFPKAYDALLNQLIAVLKNRLSPAKIDELLREVGRALGEAAAKPHRNGLESRVQNALLTLEKMGGVARIETNEAGFVIQSNVCPLAAAVNAHPDVCHLAETLVAEIVKAPVKEHCHRSAHPHCRFEIDATSAK